MEYILANTGLWVKYATLTSLHIQHTNESNTRIVLDLLYLLNTQWHIEITTTNKEDEINTGYRIRWNIFQDWWNMLDTQPPVLPIEYY